MLSEYVIMEIDITTKQETIDKLDAILVDIIDFIAMNTKKH